MSSYFCYPDNRLPADSDDAFSAEELDEIAQLVRESSFHDDESGLSIEERMIDVFRGKEPEWSGFQSLDGTCYVNCGGVISENGEDLGVVLQFELSEDMTSFILSGMLINGVEQPESLIIKFEDQFGTYDDEEEHTEPDDDEDGVGDWGDDAAERFWYGSDDDYDDDDDCDCGGHHH